MPGLATADLAQGQVTLVNIWASWCAPCRRSLPWLDGMQRKYAADGLVIIGVNEDNTSKAAEAFLKDVPVDFEIVLDLAGDIAREYELIAMPSTYVFGRDGKLASRHLGFKTAKQDEYEALLRSLLDDGEASVAFALTGAAGGSVLVRVTVASARRARLASRSILRRNVSPCSARRSSLLHVDSKSPRTS